MLLPAGRRGAPVAPMQGLIRMAGMGQPRAEKSTAR